MVSFKEYFLPSSIPGLTVFLSGLCEQSETLLMEDLPNHTVSRWFSFSPLPYSSSFSSISVATHVLCPEVHSIYADLRGLLADEPERTALFQRQFISALGIVLRFLCKPRESLLSSCPSSVFILAFLSPCLPHYGVQWLKNISPGCWQVSVPCPLGQSSSLASSLELELSGE